MNFMLSISLQNIFVIENKTDGSENFLPQHTKTNADCLTTDDDDSDIDPDYVPSDTELKNVSH